MPIVLISLTIAQDCDFGNLFVTFNYIHVACARLYLNM